MDSAYSHLVINMMVISILIIILALVMKKFKISKYINNPHIKVLTAISVGHKEKLILIQIKDKQLLLGATPTHIETLQVFDEIEVPAVESINNPPKVFSDYFKRKG